MWRTMTSWGSRWRSRVVEAVADDNTCVLQTLAGAALKHVPSSTELAETGVGVLLADMAIWEPCDQQT